MIKLYLHVDRCSPAPDKSRAKEFAEYFSGIVELELGYETSIGRENGTWFVEIRSKQGRFAVGEKDEDYIRVLYERCKDEFFGTKMDVDFMA